MPGIEGRVRIVLNDQLRKFGSYLATQLSCDPQRKIDAGRDAATAHEAPTVIMPIINATPTRRVVFQYLVPVHVEVEDGLVTRVTVIDETPVRDPAAVEGDATYLAEAVMASDDGQPWPSWSFGY